MISAVRQPLEIPLSFRNIVIALDHSDASHRALLWAADNILNKATDCAYIVNVRPLPLLATPFQPEFFAKEKEEEKNKAQVLVVKYVQLLEAKGIKAEGITIQGDPREQIVEKCEEIDADLLILGSVGSSVMKRMFVGSVSDYCFRNCKCSVLVHR